MICGLDLGCYLVRLGVLVLLLLLVGTCSLGFVGCWVGCCCYD